MNDGRVILQSKEKKSYCDMHVQNIDPTFMHAAQYQLLDIQ